MAIPQIQIFFVIDILNLTNSFIMQGNILMQMLFQLDIMQGRVLVHI